jgi:hypothetical protein
MQFLIENWKTWSTIIGVVPILFVVIRFCLDNFNIFNVEKKFMSNTKKVGISISNGFLFSIPLFILFFILESFNKNKFSFDSNIDRILFHIAIFISLFLIYLFLNSLVQAYFKFIKPKIKYCVELPEDDNLNTKKKWYIERKVGKDQILLSNNIDSYKFHCETDIKKHEIKLEVQLSDKKKGNYKKIKKNKKCMSYVLIILFLIISLIFVVNFVNTLLAIILYIVLSIIVIAFVTIFVIDKILQEIKAIDDKKKDEESKVNQEKN